MILGLSLWTRYVEGGEPPPPGDSIMTESGADLQDESSIALEVESSA